MKHDEKEPAIIGGVDTHKDSHTAAAITELGTLLGTQTFPANAQGYEELLDWLRTHGTVDRIGVEGTGSYGSGLSEFLRQAGVAVEEVNRPNRQSRRRHGKTDDTDAVSAARTTLAGEALGSPKVRNSLVEAIRVLRVERRSAIHSRTKTANQLHALVTTAPEPLRAELRGLSVRALVDRARRMRCPKVTDVESATKRALRGLGRRWHALHEEIGELDVELEPLVRKVAPDLVALVGVGIDVAGSLLVAAGGNPERLRSERSFAALCGASPVDASSGKQHRHRLNRGGNRDANRALWVIALVRFRRDPRTRDYVARRTAEGLSKPEIMRCLKRFIAREVFKVLRSLAPSTKTSASPQEAA